MRNLAKKAVLRGGLLRLAAGLRGPGAAILMYHSVMEDIRCQNDLLGGIIHSRAAFREQIELLARQYSPVSLDQVERFVLGQEELPDRAVVVTFDDGYADNCDIAVPLLNEAGVSAAFYVTVDCVEQGKLPGRRVYVLRFVPREKEAGPMLRARPGPFATTLSGSGRTCFPATSAASWWARPRELCCPPRTRARRASAYRFGCSDDEL